MKSINDIVQSVFPMSNNSLSAIIDLVEQAEYPKGEVFIKDKKRNNKEYFIIEGIVKSYLFSPDGEEITISFFNGGSIISPYTTRTNNGVSNLNFKALTNVVIGSMDAREFESLMVENLEVREFGNSVLRNELKSKVEKEIGLASLSAKDRLKKFRITYPQLENIVPHTDIATYLGITNISLSRLRRELMD